VTRFCPVWYVRPWVIRWLPLWAMEAVFSLARNRRGRTPVPWWLRPFFRDENVVIGL